MTCARVSATEAKQLLDEQGYLYLDVRSVPEFDGGHPAGAYNVPLMHIEPGGMVPNPEFLEVVQACFATDARLVVGCRSGGRSAKAAQLILDAGYRNVIELQGGFAGETDAFGRMLQPGWQAAGLPVRALPETGRSYAELCQKARNVSSVSQRRTSGRLARKARP